MKPTGRQPRIQYFSGTRERAEHIAAEVRAACDAFFRSRNMPASFAPQAMAGQATEAPTALESPIHKSDMNDNRRIIHESKPAPEPRKWRSKAREQQPAPLMKPDWRKVVAEAQARGLVTYPKK